MRATARNGPSSFVMLPSGPGPPPPPRARRGAVQQAHRHVVDHERADLARGPSLGAGAAMARAGRARTSPTPARRRRSRRARCRAWRARPSSPGPPCHDILVGHEHVVEEHLVEVRVAGDIAQRPHRHALGVHVDHHHREAEVLGARRGRCARWRSRDCSAARRSSTPSDRHAPAAGDLRTARLRAAASEPAFGSLNSWQNSISPSSGAARSAPPDPRDPCCAIVSVFQPLIPSSGRRLPRPRTPRRSRAARPRRRRGPTASASAARGNPSRAPASRGSPAASVERAMNSRTSVRNARPRAAGRSRVSATTLRRPRAGHVSSRRAVGRRSPTSVPERRR